MFTLRRNHRPDAAADCAEYGARYKYVSTGSAGTGTDDAGGLGWGVLVFVVKRWKQPDWMHWASS
jgi:hypothetical protein